MSGNPFRRSSLKGPAASTPFTLGPATSETAEITIPLSLDTGGVFAHYIFSSLNLLTLLGLLSEEHSADHETCSVQISPGSSIVA